MGNKHRHPLAIDALKRFRIIYGSVRQHFREIEQQCGISGSQLWVLQEVALQPGIGVSTLAELLSIHQSTCSQLVEKLVVSRLLLKERSRLDQRRVGLSLSAKARRILATAPGPLEGVFPDALKGMDDSDLRQLNASLERVIGQLRQRDQKCANKPLADL